jgi:hypothetical protein
MAVLRKKAIKLKWEFLNFEISPENEQRRIFFIVICLKVSRENNNATKEWHCCILRYFIKRRSY